LTPILFILSQKCPQGQHDVSIESNLAELDVVYVWVDSYIQQLDTLFRICSQAAEFLKNHKKSLIFVLFLMKVESDAFLIHFLAECNCNVYLMWNSFMTKYSDVVKAESLQVNRTQFPSPGIFVSKKVGNRKN
jgi:hypothetical protein